jgi:hypothetical protein
MSTLMTASHIGVKVGDIVSIPVTVYSQRERFLCWLLNRGLRGRLVALLFCGWFYRPKGRQVRREYRITDTHGGECTVTVVTP